MPLHDLKDLGECIEKLRRLRRDLGEGDVRNAMDRQLLRLTEHVEGIVGDDERLKVRREAREQARAACPQPNQWHFLEVKGKVAAVVDLIIEGAKAADAWKRVLDL